MTYLFLHLILCICYWFSHLIGLLSATWLSHVSSLGFLFIFCFSLTKGQCSKRWTILSVLAVHRPFSICFFTVVMVYIYTIRCFFTVVTVYTYTVRCFFTVVTVYTYTYDVSLRLSRYISIPYDVSLLLSRYISIPYDCHSSVCDCLSTSQSLYVRKNEHNREF